MNFNFLLMAIGEFLEICAFFASIPATIFHAVAQQFYFAGNPPVENNNEENDED